MLTKALEDEDPQVRLLVAMVMARIERKKADKTASVQIALRKAQKQVESPLQALQAMSWRTALSNPLVQAQLEQLVMFYVLENAAFGGESHFLDPLLSRLGPEAVPALVKGINFTAAYRLGFC